MAGLLETLTGTANPQGTSGVNRFGNALQGLGAALQGQGQDWQRNQMLKKQMADEALLERKKASVQDFRAVNQMLQAGNMKGAMGILERRAQVSADQNQDPKDTIEFMGLLRSDPAAAMQQLNAIDAQAVSRGWLDALPKPETFTLKSGESRVQFNPQTGKYDVVATGAEKPQTEKERLTVQKLKLEIEQSMRDAAQENRPSLKAIQGISQRVGDLTKETRKIRGAASRLDNISQTKSATDKLAAIFTFMKALDPTSVVREGEQQAAVMTGGITDQLASIVQQAQGEGRITAGVFDNMVTTAKRLANQSIADSGTTVSDFVNSFGDRLNETDRKNLLGRLPKAFELSPDQMSLRERAEARNTAGGIGDIDLGDRPTVTGPVGLTPEGRSAFEKYRRVGEQGA